MRRRVLRLARSLCARPRPVFQACVAVCIVYAVYRVSCGGGGPWFVWLTSTFPAHMASLGMVPERGNELMRSTDQSLRAYNGKFYLEGQEITIRSGAVHYFRVIPQYWRHRFQLLIAAGLNTVETYVAWNMHEPHQGNFDFHGRSDIRKFVQMAQEEGLYVLLRPGPYICAEWEFGGLPSWLLRNASMRVRSSHPPFLEAVDRYFAALTSQISDLQYHQGGAIIGFQIENEYGGFGLDDMDYVEFLTKSMYTWGLRELYFTSDNKRDLERFYLPGVLSTANFQSLKGASQSFDVLLCIQPRSPLMVMEFWSGWFDHWQVEHQSRPHNKILKVLDFILEQGSSFNLYMFHGGTNFGFMNGANSPSSVTVTSYDYDAPVTESGSTTKKYTAIRKLLETKFSLTLPPIPAPKPTKAYGTVAMTHVLPLALLLQSIEAIRSKHVVTMEMLDINGRGQAYGFILYRKKDVLGRNIAIHGTLNDRALVMIDNKTETVLDWTEQNPNIPLHGKSRNAPMLVDILVENQGRVNYVGKKDPRDLLDKQRKGINGHVTLDGDVITDWLIYPLEFPETWVNSIYSSPSWIEIPHREQLDAPVLVKGRLLVKTPKDTFIDMKQWKKCQVFINGFNLGRYWSTGPQRTLYVPGPLLRVGENEIVIFELHRLSTKVTFITQPILAEDPGI